MRARSSEDFGDACSEGAHTGGTRARGKEAKDTIHRRKVYGQQAAEVQTAKSKFNTMTVATCPLNWSSDLLPRNPSGT